MEIYHNGTWGTICDDAWDDVDAQVVCSTLALEGGTALEDNEYGSGEGVIWLDEVECTGSELLIEDCPSNPWGENDCWHFEDAGVQCGRSFFDSK